MLISYPNPLLFATEPANPSRSSRQKATTPDTIDVYKINHNTQGDELDKHEAKTTGAFVPVNNDDDDYSIKGATDGADVSQKGQVTGEDDLLPFVIHKSASGGQYILRYNGQLVAAYKSSDRSQALDAGMPFDVPAGADLILCIEGRAIGATPLSLDWIDPNHKTHLAVDQVKATVFNWTGPLNVPAHATEEYKANFSAHAPRARRGGVGRSRRRGDDRQR